MRASKKIGFKDIVQIKVVGFLGAFSIWLLRQTLRIEIRVPDDQSKDWAAETPRILAFWHRQQLLMPWIYRQSKNSVGKRPICALISKSLDGRMVAQAMNFLGISSVEGSSSRGGREALFEMVKAVKDGSHVAITPDGPRGPIFKVKFGVIKIAQLTGAKIYPTCFVPQKSWTFGSWDKMLLPKPFSRAIILTGSPIQVPSELKEEELPTYAEKLEQELNRVTSEAEGLLR